MLSNSILVTLILVSIFMEISMSLLIHYQGSLFFMMLGGGLIPVLQFNRVFSLQSKKSTGYPLKKKLTNSPPQTNKQKKRGGGENYKQQHTHSQDRSTESDPLTVSVLLN